MHNLVQGTPEWETFRRDKIMASEAPIIMGTSPWMTPLELFWSKIEGSSQVRNPGMTRGIILEPEAREAFEAICGAKVEPKVITHPSEEWMGASVDGINEEAGVLVEIKCPNELDHFLALKGEIPEKYQAQLQHQMYVCQFLQMYYFSYRPNHPQPCGLVVVGRDGVYVSELLKKERDFYEKLMSKEPPDPNERDLKKHQKMLERDIFSPSFV